MYAPSRFRVFRLQRAIVASPDFPGDGTGECVCTPRGPGHDQRYRLDTPERPLPKAKTTVLTMMFAPPSNSHWTLTLDTEFDSTLAAMVQACHDREVQEAAARVAASSKTGGPTSATHQGKKQPQIWTSLLFARSW